MATAATPRLPPEWQLHDDECPRDTLAHTVRFALRYAVLAPSTHNAQPWRFRIGSAPTDGATVDVMLDTGRGLPVTDEQDREGVISVGAAVFNLRVALARFGLACHVQLWPEPLDPECCARVTVAMSGQVDTAVAALLDAVPLRHTSRGPFRPDTVPAPALTALRDAARAEGARLHVQTDYVDRHAIAELVGEADRRQMADHRFRRELAAWLRTGASRRRDGIRGYPLAHDDILSVAAPVIVRTFDIGTGRAARDHELAAFSPVIALLTTPGDDRSDWLTAGQALERVLLSATGAGVGVGFLDQPIEVPELRADVATAFGTTDVPQLLLRLGYATAHHGPPVQRRRPVEEVLLP